MTTEEMREKIGEFFLLGKHWDGAKALWTDLEDEEGSNSTGHRLKIFTDRHSYSIVMRPEQDGKKSYLGCIKSLRAPLPGETWTRGGDLADGEFNDATLTRILSDILSCELHVINIAHAPKEVTEEVTGPSLGD